MTRQSDLGTLRRRNDALIFQLALRFTNSILPALYSAFALAVSHTFWWHSSTPEVYTLFTFLLASSLIFFDRYERDNKLTDLIISAFFFGLSASDHILAFLICRNSYISTSKNRSDLNLVQCALHRLPREALQLISFQFHPPDEKFSRQTDQQTALLNTFLSGLGAVSLLVIGGSVLKYFLFLALQFGPVGIVLGASGFRSAMRNDDQSVRKIVACFIVYALFGIFYRVADQFAFFLTSYIFFAILMGLGLNGLFSTLREKARFTLTVSLLLLILLTPPFYRLVPSLAESGGADDASIGIPPK
ncbi:MAG: DUF2723 domain-containing protein [Anaerolineales bacterium]